MYGNKLRVSAIPDSRIKNYCHFLSNQNFTELFSTNKTMHLSLSFLPLIALCVHFSAGQNFFDKTAFIFVSQTDNGQVGSKFANELPQFLKDYGVKVPKVQIIGEDFPGVGRWSYFPIFPKLWDLFGSSTNWFVFLNEFSLANLKNLEQSLSKFNASQNYFVGHAIVDQVRPLLN